MTRVAPHPSEPPPAEKVAWRAQGQAAGLDLLAWSLRSTRIMMELNQSLFSIGLDLLARQQEAVSAAFEGMLRPGGEQPRAAGDDGFTGVARLGMELVEQMTSAMRLANDRGRPPTSDPSAAAPRRQDG